MPRIQAYLKNEKFDFFEISVGFRFGLFRAPRGVSGKNLKNCGSYGKYLVGGGA